MARNDQVLKLQMVDGTDVYLYADRRANMSVSAVSRLENARIGTGAGFIRVHKGEDRYSDVDNVNVVQVVRYTEMALPLPTEIQQLYTEPAGETEEARDARQSKIRNYFEIL